jgi:hypothetical protein
MHPMFKDPEANICYSLKSLTMSEEILDLNAIAINRHPLNAFFAPAKVTFNQVHFILYGDPSSKLIYQNVQKSIDKKSDRTYPDTHLEADVFSSIIEKIDSKLKHQFIVKVGSFTGNSAIIMGNVLKNAYHGSFLLCIDTWLGGMCLIQF